MTEEEKQELMKKLVEKRRKFEAENHLLLLYFLHKYQTTGKYIRTAADNHAIASNIKMIQKYVQDWLYLNSKSANDLYYFVNPKI